MQPLLFDLPTKTVKQFDSEQIPVKYTLTPDNRAKLLSAQTIAFDIETSNSDYDNVHDPDAMRYYEEGASLGLSYNTKLILLTLWTDTIPEGIAVGHKELENNLDFFKELFGQPSIRFVGHNLVFDLRILCGHYGLPIPPRIWDTMTMEALFADGDPGGKDALNSKSYSLAGLVDIYSIILDTRPLVEEKLGLCLRRLDARQRKEINIPPYTALVSLDHHELLKIYKKFKSVSRKTLDSIDVEESVAYAILDVIFTWYLYKAQAKRMVRASKEGYTHLLTVAEWEARFSRVCVEMACRGLRLNIPLLKQRLTQWTNAAYAAKESMIHFSLAYLRDYFDEVLGYHEYEDVVEYYRARPSKRTEIIDNHIDIYRGILQGQFNPAEKKYAEFYLYDVCKVVPRKWSRANLLFFTEKGSPAFTKHTLPYYQKDYPLVVHYATWLGETGHINKAKEFLAHASTDGRIHPLIVSSTVTGRTSAKQPNTQNSDVKQHETEDDLRFLGIYDSNPGEILIGADIVSAEVYASAVVARDNTQLAALLTGDYHNQTAKEYFKSRYDFTKSAKEGVNATLRNLSKSINFGTAYGMGPEKLIRTYKDVRESMTPSQDEIDELLENNSFIGWATNENVELLPVDIVSARPQDVLFAATVWKARQLLKSKQELFSAVTLAQEEAKLQAEQGYIELWSGRRCYVRWQKKVDKKTKKETIERAVQNGWNIKCQGFVGELAKRWAVLVLEQFEKYPKLRAHIVNFVHDELVFECPVEYHEVVTRIVINAFYEAPSYFPMDDEGRHWFDRTTPRTKMLTDVNHKDNAAKWGYNPNKEYPIDKSLIIGDPDQTWVDNWLATYYNTL